MTVSPAGDAGTFWALKRADDGRFLGINTTPARGHFWAWTLDPSNAYRHASAARANVFRDAMVDLYPTFFAGLVAVEVKS